MELRTLVVGGCLAVVLVLASCLLFRDLGAEGIEIDEAVTTAWTVEMLERGNWLIPSLNGQPDLRKPPLKMWLVGATLLVFPATELTLRFWDALAGLVTVGLVFWVANRLAGPLAGLGSALILGSMPAFLFDHSARTNVHDSLLWLFVTAATLLYGFGPQTIRAAALAGMLCGAAFLTKGPAGLVALAVVATYELLTTRHRAVFAARLWAYGLSALALAAPWYLAAAILAPDAFFESVGYEFRNRLLGETHRTAPVDYWRQVASHFGWWLAAVPAALFAIRRHGPNAWILPIWAVVGIACFAVGAIQFPWYVVPAYPAIAALIGVGIGEMTRTVSRRIRWAPAISAVAIGACLAPSVLAALERIEDVRYRPSSLRRFVEYVEASVPASVPVLVDESSGLRFRRDERFYAYRLRDRLRRLSSPGELCAELERSSAGAFVVTDDPSVARIACLGEFTSSLTQTREADIPREQPERTKRILGFGVPLSPLFATRDVVLDFVAGDGLGFGWSAELVVDPPIRRAIPGDRAFAFFDLNAGEIASIRLEGRWPTGCAPGLTLNAVPLATVVTPGGVEASGPVRSVAVGTNALSVERRCAGPLGASRLSIRPAFEEAVPELRRFNRTVSAGHRSVGRTVHDELSVAGRTTAAGPPHSGAGYAFFLPQSLPNGHYTVRFHLRALGAARGDVAARVDVIAADRIFSTRDLVDAELSSVEEFVPIELRFVLDRPERVQPRVYVTGTTEVRVSSVSIETTPGWP